MDQETWKTIRTRESHTWGYLILLIVAAIFSGLVLECLYLLFKLGKWKPLLFFSGADTAVITGLVFLERKMKKEGAGKRNLPPIRVNIKEASAKGFAQRLRNRLKMEPLAPQIDTAYITGEINVLYTLYELPEFPGNKALASLRDKTTPKARARYGLPETMPLSSVRKSHRINLFMFENADGGMEDAAKLNAAMGMSRPETVLNVYISLGSRQILIPDCAHLYQGVLSRYVACMETLDALIRELN